MNRKSSLSEVLSLKNNHAAVEYDIATLSGTVASHEARLDVAEGDIADLYTGLTQNIVVVTQVTPSVLTSTLHFTDGRLTSIT